MIRGDEAKFELTLSFDELTLIYKSLMAAKSLGILSQEDEFVDDTIECCVKAVETLLGGGEPAAQNVVGDCNKRLKA